MAKLVGLETSSIMPLVEVTPRTLPLQQAIREASKEGCLFLTDRYSLVEARNQITTSYDNAVRSIHVAEEKARKRAIDDPRHLQILLVKALAENWYGREETLRWSDAALAVGTQHDNLDFFGLARESVTVKRDEYLAALPEKALEVTIDASDIKSYWVTPDHARDVRVTIRVITNQITLQDFFTEFQPTVHAVYKEKITIIDVIDFYHLYSLYHDGAVIEVWSCNQHFVKRHERYLRNLESNTFAAVLKAVRIRRIK